MIPVTAVGRTAGAVGGLADCGVVVGMTRSRVWIGVLGVLLGGIVALNVWGLGLSAGSSATAAKIDAMQRENGVRRARAASSMSNDWISAEVARLGLAVPAPDGVRYLDGGSGDAVKAAERLGNGRITVAPPPLPESEEAIDPETGLPIDPATVDAVEPAAAEPIEPATIDPATGLTIDPATGLAIDPATGAAIDPATGLPVAP